MNTTTIATPAGPLTVIATGAGAVLAAGFSTQAAELLPGPVGQTVRVRPDLGDISKAVAAYLDGDLTAIEAVPVELPAASEFRAAVWQALRDSRPGQPLTYTGLAARAGRPAAVRAAATACARNPAALFVPCHRVMRADGRLGGYRWGVAVKRWLLAHERR
jgi:methylated-DNA-[protein]-cysteine S-methyltransferase